jgi:hypothetical protein
MPRAFRSALMIAIASALGLTPLRAQTPEEQVNAVVDLLMTSIGRADSATAASLFHPDANLVIVDSREGRRSVQTLPASDLAASVGQSGGVWEERVWDPQVLFDGDLALVWAPYDFHIDGRFSHCGVDAFHLARAAEGWKIISIVYTRRVEDCDSPPGQ